MFKILRGILRRTGPFPTGLDDCSHGSSLIGTQKQSLMKLQNKKKNFGKAILFVLTAVGKKENFVLK